MLTFADNFQIGAALTLIMPLGLLFLLAIGFFFVLRRVPHDTHPSAVTLPPADMVAAAGEAVHELSPTEEPPPGD